MNFLFANPSETDVCVATIYTDNHTGPLAGSDTMIGDARQRFAVKTQDRRAVEDYISKEEYLARVSLVMACN